MAHARPLLAVANACHPDMDPGERYRRLCEVIRNHDGACGDRWRARLEHAAARRADYRLAMRLLRDLERESNHHRLPEPFHESPATISSASVWSVSVVALVIALAAIVPQFFSPGGRDNG